MEETSEEIHGIYNDDKSNEKFTLSTLTDSSSDRVIRLPNMIDKTIERVNQLSNRD